MFKVTFWVLESGLCLDLFWYLTTEGELQFSIFYITTHIADILYVMWPENMLVVRWEELLGYVQMGWFSVPVASHISSGHFQKLCEWQKVTLLTVRWLEIQDGDWYWMSSNFTCPIKSPHVSWNVCSFIVISFLGDNIIFHSFIVFAFTYSLSLVWQ